MKLNEFEECFQYALDQSKKFPFDVRVEQYRPSNSANYRRRRGILFKIYDRFGAFFNSYLTGTYEDRNVLMARVKATIDLINQEV